MAATERNSTILYIEYYCEKCFLIVAFTNKVYTVLWILIDQFGCLQLFLHHNDQHNLSDFVRLCSHQGSSTREYILIFVDGFVGVQIGESKLEITKKQSPYRSIDILKLSSTLIGFSYGQVYLNLQKAIYNNNKATKKQDLTIIKNFKTIKKAVKLGTFKIQGRWLFQFLIDRSEIQFVNSIYSFFNLILIDFLLY